MWPGIRSAATAPCPLLGDVPKLRCWRLFVYLLLVGFTWMPFFMGFYGALYALALLPVHALVGYVLWQLHRQRAVLADDRLGRLLKVGMFLGLVAIVVGEAVFALG